MKNNQSQVKTFEKITKLEDTSLSCISGGLSDSADLCLYQGGPILNGVGLFGGLISSVVTAVYSSKASKAMANGNTENAKKYAGVTKKAAIATAAFGGLALAGQALTAIAIKDATRKYL
ncbi:MAG: hypothetical protein Q4D57_05160 [Clostridia bacterium]|nr:hypothetical protein [Clostridia bacterium]